ncbi:cytochrome P450 [Stereum hirsutum FP-91666 SS1]|uniref:cytochrome P450 n=1 Tax=Stereum hirsutum (strain FP-91666) TaxID=721885 RepID=UPI000440E5B3|nr:cytochrome P450 [Stereum hirsutum FP-91666 SS1]EIM91637.1 cytochrome P450 [Stereum hirsutum FP-91666 SS1]
MAVVVVPLASAITMVALGCGAVFLSLLVHRTAQEVAHAYRTPLRSLRGPKSNSVLFGSFKDVLEYEAYRTQERWIQQYGPIFKFQSFLNRDYLMIMDKKALHYVLSKFEKTPIVNFAIRGIVGEGILTVTGSKHKQQRKLMSPAFGAMQIRSFIEIFLNKSNQLRDILLHKTTQSHRTDGAVTVDMYGWLSQATLDIIGLAGFHHDFNTLNSSEDGHNEITQAVWDLFDFKEDEISYILQLFLPVTRIIPTERTRKQKRALNVLHRLGHSMIEQKKIQVLKEAGPSDTSSNASGSLQKADVQGRDLLSLLMKANMASDIPEDARMSDDEIVSQIPAFLIAGYETTSTAIAWLLFNLACDQRAQKKLRDELQALHSEKPTMDELSELPYLDMVVRESLRLHPPISNSERVATEDDVIPLETEFLDRYGKRSDHVRVIKGDIIYIPIRAMNRSKELWGEDAHEFKPERWENIPDKVSAIPSVWNNTMTFLAGSHACMGFRFAVIEIKAMLFTLLRTLELELAITPEDIGRKTNIVGRPYVISDPDEGPQLPMLVREVSYKGKD